MYCSCWARALGRSFTGGWPFYFNVNGTASVSGIVTAPDRCFRAQYPNGDLLDGRNQGHQLSLVVPHCLNLLKVTLPPYRVLWSPFGGIYHHGQHNGSSMGLSEVVLTILTEPSCGHSDAGRGEGGVGSGRDFWQVQRNEYLNIFLPM